MCFDFGGLGPRIVFWDSHHQVVNRAIFFFFFFFHFMVDSVTAKI